MTHLYNILKALVRLKPKHKYKNIDSKSAAFTKVSCMKYDLTS